MSGDRRRVEAKLASALYEELLVLEKEAFIGQAIKGIGVAAKSAPRLARAGKWLAKIPHAAYYRTTGRVVGQGSMSKAQKAKKLRDIGIEGADSLRSSVLREASSIGQVQKGTAKPKGLLARAGIGRGKFDNVTSLRDQYGSLSKAPTADLQKAIGSKGKTLAARAEAHKMGLTNIPGYAKSMVKNPLKTLKTGWNAESRGSKAMTAGFAGLSGYNVATAPKGERLKTLAEELPGTALYAATGPLGWGAQLLGDELGTRAAKGAVGLLQKRRAPVGALAKTQAAPSRLSGTVRPRTV